MSVARAIRILLVGCTLLLVVWAFFDVARRSYEEYRARTSRAVTLTVLHWGNPAETQIVESLVRRYERENPHVRILRIGVPGSGELASKLKTMVAAGDPPDVFYLAPDMLSEAARYKLVRPIDDYIAADRAAGVGAFYDDFFPLLLDAFRYDIEAQRVGQGPLYGLPKDFTTAIFYINVDLFEAAGVDYRRIQDEGWTWDEFADVTRRITDLNGRPPFVGGDRVFGSFFQLWPDTIRNIVWTYGGEFFGPGGFKDVALDSPQTKAALEMIARLRLKERTSYNPTGIAKDGGDEFLNGRIGLIGPIGRWRTPDFKNITAFRWDVVPVPYHKPEFESSQIFYTAWAMANGSKHPEESFKLIKFLTGPDGAAMQSRLGLAIPPLQSVANSPDFLNPQGIPKHRSDLFLRAMEHARLQQNPPQPEWSRIIGDRIGKAISLSDRDDPTRPLASVDEVAAEIRDAWLAELNSPLRQRQWNPMPWTTVMLITGAIGVTLAAVLYTRARREKLGPLDRAQERAGFAFIAPWLIGFALLTIGPMIASLLLSFSRWSGMTPIGTAEGVGVANYRQLFFADPTFVQSLKVTGYYVLLAVPISQVLALAVALLMNTGVRFITFFRTVYFVPSVVSGAALAVLWLQIYNNDYGILNKLLAPITGLFGKSPPDWFGNDIKVWGIPAFVIMGLWGVGGGMIIYLAGLKGIPRSLYEAAYIDGAGPMRRLAAITLPMLSPLIFYNLVMGIIGSFQVFTQAYMMTGAGTDNATLFYVYSLFRHAFEFHNMGYASAMAWVLFVIVLVLTLAVFRGSRNLVYYEGLKT